MRVLFLAKSFGTHGGVERWLDLLVEGLERESFDCAVALADGLHHDSGRYAAAHPGLRSFPLRNPSGAPSSRLLAVRKALRSIRPTIVVPLILYDGLLGAALEKARLGFRLVYSLHGSRGGALQDVRDFGAAMDAVVAVDGFTHNVVLQMGLAPPSRLHLIHCGVPLARTATGFLSQERVRIGYCGRIEQEDKRVFDLVNFCSELVELGIPFELRIAGQGSREAELRERMRNRLGDGGAVSWLGARDPEWLYSGFYPEIDVLLVTSDSEAGPLVAVEAMVHRCLVLSSDFIGRVDGDLLKDRVNCLVFPVGDMKIAAAHLERVLRDRPLARALTDAGFETAQSRSVEVMVSKWRELLLSVTREEPALAPADAKVTPSYRGASRLEKLGLGARVADLVRRALGRKFRHATPGSEWPMHSVADPDLDAVYARKPPRRLAQ